MSNPFATGRYGGGGSTPQQAAGTGQQGDLETQIVNTVRQDMDCVDKSGQWVFSCYSPAKDCASVPGMEDISLEELRLEAYVAKAGNNLAQYTSRVSGLIDTYSKSRAQLRNPDQGLRQTLVKIYNKESIAGAQPVGGSVFGGAGSSTGGGGLFGGSQQQQGSAPGVFGGAQQSSGGQGIFGGASSTQQGGGLFGKSGGGMFSNTPSGSSFGQSSVFGGGAATTTTQPSGSSIFGGGGTAGTSSNTSGIFGGSAPTTQPSGGGSVFGGAPAFGGGGMGVGATSSGGIFGGGSSQPAFGAPATQASSIFGGGATQTTQQASGGPFSTPQKPTGSIFGAPATSNPSVAGSAFSTPQQSSGSIFGSSSVASAVEAPKTAVTGQALFGGGTAPVAGGTTGQGIFGAPVSSTSGSGLFGTPGGGGGGGGLFGQSGGGGGLFGKAEPAQAKEIDMSVLYTALDQLSAQDKAAFEAAEFELGKVPTVPPPRELCV